MLILTAYEDCIGSPYQPARRNAPGRWHSVVDGEIIYRGKLPHFGAARALIKAGHAPETPITTQTRTGTPVFNSTLAKLAAVTVEETDSGKTPPILRRYKEWPKSAFTAPTGDPS